MMAISSVVSRISLRHFAVALIATFAVLSLITPATAQFSESYNFLKAVRDRDGTEANELLDRPGNTVINSRDIKSGETALHITIARRDLLWTRFMLQKGANPNIETREGLTPLMLATNLRFVDGAEALLKRNAAVDKANRSGETPLIRAVQLGDLAMVRLLLKNGADPDRVDSLAGQSARDYASNNVRLAPILSAIEKSDEDRANQAEKPAVFGPTIRQ
ncbi:ankyrin repeat domain-containing protein [Alterisphingorhabdus coralli]|uniref:Ankyrin repeat domain-containing protein n=1 Tax=Alterisphingorhabdus coralli TaxID=3071408 RepID=A0AA97I193_9SPHN|nr:ankyrin repeat domain-containing protein [Parasphingorhabdus sp. SCSIO 66989]WOE75827.1 ankyrin repeat domain-containing protein [Parasphingorhabdus sp. SCSIO 66989]